MKYVAPFLFLVCGCTNLPQLFQSAEQVLTDNAIEVNVSREAIVDTEKDVNIIVEVVKPKDEKK